MQQTLLFFSQPLPPPPATPPENSLLLKPGQKATLTTCLIPLTDKQIVQLKESQTAVVEERTLTRLYPTESLSELQSDSVFGLKLLVVVGGVFFSSY